MDTENIQNQINQLKQKQQLNRRERRYLEKLEGKLQPEQKKQKSNISLHRLKSIGIKLGFLLISVLLIVAGVKYVLSRPNLPPTDMQGHIEQNPPSHILNSDMPDAVQRHMLEHADGEGKNGEGILIHYNCNKYACEQGLINKLTSIVKKYPKNVYLMPGNYDGKIILTRMGRREILSSYDEKKIIDFIEK